MSEQTVPLVAHIIYSLGTGGLENGLVNIINRSPPERYRHVIICLTTAQEFAQRITAPGVEVFELHKRDGQDWSMYLRLFRLLRELRPRVIHSRNLAALDTQVLGFLLPGVKQVHGEHGRDIYDLDGSNWKYRQLRRFMRFFIDRYIAVSLDLSQWLQQSVGVSTSRLRQIYNGVDHQKFQPRTGRRPDVLPAHWAEADSLLVIGTVGRLAEVKDQSLILKATARLVEQQATWRDCLRVVLVGDGPMASALAEQVSSLGLEDMVWMAGDRTDIAELLQAMDIFLLPSLGEGISNTVLEAMAAGLPVIATDVGGNPELIEEGVNGRLIPVGDVDALCTVLDDLLSSDVMREQLGQQALLGVRERFDWSRTVSEYLQVYDELLGKVNVKNGGESAVIRMKDLEAG